MTVDAPTSDLWSCLGLPAAALADLTLTGAEPALPSSFALGTAARAAVAASALAAAQLHHRRGGPRQAVRVDMRHAATDFHSEHWLTFDGESRGDGWDRIAGLHRCGDGRWVRLHTNFPHHRAGVLRLLGCDYDRAAVTAALQSWTAFGFEDAAAEAGLCVTAARDFAEWDAHPNGIAVQAEPLIGFERLDDAPPRPLPPAAARPLAGLLVLDLTRVIAGPVASRTLAAHGAEVLRITAPHLFNPLPLEIDTSRGKRSAQLDLRDPAARETLAGLIGEADVFIQGYRQGALAGHGFGPERIAALRPGIVQVSLCAYGFTGPWASRRGFDSLTQTASGMNLAEAAAAGEAVPRALPVQALDHASGYLLAAGALAGLARRAEQGGSWHVRVSLARTGHWIRGLGRLADGFSAPMPERATVADLLEGSESGFGRLEAVRHPGVLAATPAFWALPSVPPGTHPARWG